MTSNNLNIILIKTLHPANIGSTARAMKTMGFENLSLVAPCYFPSPTANAMASRATDILEKAKVHTTLLEAVNDTQLIFGTSSRERVFDWPMLSLREASLLAAQSANANQKVSFIFGTESTGMTNDELKLCHYHVYIPANKNFASLNLAQAVQVACYELMMAFNEVGTQKFPERILAPYENLERFYEHLETIAERVEFLKGPHGEVMKLKLRRLFQRAQLDDSEITTLRGILRNIERKLK